MITPDKPDELTTLARARVGLSPSPADVLRVRASLVGALAAPADSAFDAAPSGSGPGLGTGAGWTLRVLVTSVAVATVGAGAAGYWLGYRAGTQETRPPGLAALTNERKPPSPPSVSVGVEAPSPALVSPGPPLEVPSAREGVKRRAGSPTRGGQAEGVASTPESLGQEVRALRAIEHALRDKDPRLALALLQQLERDVPKGKLLEERRAMSVIARCSTGDVPFGVNLAEDFAGDHPDSVYLARVEQSCEPRERRK
jgi:hypothetical protein